MRPGNANSQGSMLFALGEDLGWQDEALCAETDPGAFFPEKGEPTGVAKGICRRCPVTAECLSYALRNGERYGVWGGLSERERRKLAGSPGRGARVDLTTGMCSAGLHDLVGANVAVGGDGFRRCVPCRRAGEVARNARRRAARTGTEAA